MSTVLFATWLFNISWVFCTGSAFLLALAWAISFFDPETKPSRELWSLVGAIALAVVSITFWPLFKL